MRKESQKQPQEQSLSSLKSPTTLGFHLKCLPVERFLKPPNIKTLYTPEQTFNSVINLNNISTDKLNLLKLYSGNRKTSGS